MVGIENKRFTCHLVKHEEVYELSYLLAGKIMQAGYAADVVVAIARGGFPPARYICDFIDLSELASIRLKHYQSAAREQEKIDLKNPVNTEVRNRNVLIVDDVNDTGGTLETAVGYLNGLQPKNLKVGVLHEKKDSVFQADFVADYVKEWRWITYPWAMVEDIGSFLKKRGKPVDSLEEARGFLKSEYAIDITNEQLDKIFALRPHLFRSA